jgi:hypothetical protein
MSRKPVKPMVQEGTRQNPERLDVPDSYGWWFFTGYLFGEKKTKDFHGVFHFGWGDKVKISPIIDLEIPIEYFYGKWTKVHDITEDMVNEDVARYYGKAKK